MIQPALNLQNSLESIQSLAGFLDQAAQQYIVKPFSNAGLSGYLFDILDDEEVQFSSDITDHFVENNVSVQDHIALRPLKFTLRGFVWELSDATINQILSLVTKATDIGIINEYFPSFSLQAIQTYDQYATAVQSSQNAVTQANSLYELFSQKTTNGTKQQKAFNYFYTAWGDRQLFTVETPYQTYKNMAIEDVRALQRGETRLISEFSVTFKQIRTVDTLVSLSGLKAVGRSLNVLREQTTNAKTNGQKVDISVLTKTKR